MQFFIRESGEADIGSLSDLDRRIFAGDAYRPGQWLDEIRSAAVMVFLAVHTDQREDKEGQSCGFISAGLAGDELEIRKLGVLPEYRRQKLARALLMHAVEKQQHDGSELRCLLEVSEQNSGALAFYKNLGFSEYARRKRYYANGSDALLLERFFTRAR